MSGSYRIECLECGAVDFGDPDTDPEFDKEYHRDHSCPDAEFDVSFDKRPVTVSFEQEINPEKIEDLVFHRYDHDQNAVVRDRETGEVLYSDKHPTPVRREYQPDLAGDWKHSLVSDALSMLSMSGQEPEASPTLVVDMVVREGADD